MPIRLAIVDDYEVVVRGLAGMIRSASDAFEVVELDLNVSVAQPVDIALYDTFAQVQGDGPDVADLAADPVVGRVVVYSWNLGPSLVETALRHGAAGYLPKSLSAGELVAALRRIHAGETVVPTAEDEERVAGGDWPGKAEGLAPREAEVIALITQGLANQEIAAHTGLTINTVKTYIRSGYRKMGVTSRTNAVLWGLDHGFSPDRLRIKDPAPSTA